MTTTGGTSKITPPSNSRVHVLEVLGNAIAGGMENYVLRLIERLPRERFMVTALCPYESPWTARIRDLGCEVLVTPMPPDTLPWCSIQLAATLVRSAAVDVLHAHMPNAHMLAAMIGNLVGKPVLATIHARQVSTQDLEIQRVAGSHLSVVCKQTYYQALSLGVSPSRLSCIPNGVDSSRFTPRPAGQRPADGLRGRHGIPSDAPVVGFVGRLHWEKGPDVFLQAALLACHRHPQAHFVLVGDGPMRANLAELIARFSMQERIHLAGLEEDMAAVYREFDMTVSSSYSEAMPLAIMEAMASGLPVIGTQVGGVPDLIEQEHTGYLVAPGDAKAISDLLVHLLHSPEHTRTLGARARQRVLAQFELSASVERTADLLTRLVSPAPTRRVGAVTTEQAQR